MHSTTPTPATIEGRISDKRPAIPGGSLQLDFRLAPTHVTDLRPRSAPASGGTLATVTATQMTFVIPAGTGSVPVSVVRPDGYTAPFAPGFTWQDSSRLSLPLVPSTTDARSGERVPLPISLSRSEETATTVLVTAADLPQETVTIPAGSTAATRSISW